MRYLLCVVLIILSIITTPYCFAQEKQTTGEIKTTKSGNVIFVTPPEKVLIKGWGITFAVVGVLSEPIVIIESNNGIDMTKANLETMCFKAGKGYFGRFYIPFKDASSVTRAYIDGSPVTLQLE